MKTIKTVINSKTTYRTEPKSSAYANSDTSADGDNIIIAYYSANFNT
ncbi:MAG: hypothetical protein SPL89_07140 [Clostridia bacterium]|nr:hypothetical protein [Clostridia bacterium]